MSLPNLFYTDIKRDLLRFSGRDRASFLQGMVTNDVATLQPGDGCYAFMLDSTGHILADMHLLNIGDALLLDLEPGTAGFVAATLDKYLIMEKVRITDVTAEYATFAVGGTDAPEVIADAFGGDGENENPVIVGRSEAASVPMLTLYAPAMNAAQTIELLRGLTDAELPAETLDALRIESGIPRFGVDLDKSVLAPEARQDDRAVSRKKGCYIGQEIVARIDARGHTNKGLVGFFPDPAAAFPAPGTSVVVDGKSVGRVTSAAHSPTLGVPVALGFLRNEHAAPGTIVTLGDGTTAQVAALPFVERIAG